MVECYPMFIKTFLSVWCLKMLNDFFKPCIKDSTTLVEKVLC